MLSCGCFHCFRTFCKTHIFGLRGSLGLYDHNSWETQNLKTEIFEEILHDNTPRTPMPPWVFHIRGEKVLRSYIRKRQRKIMYGYHTFKCDRSPARNFYYKTTQNLNGCFITQQPFAAHVPYGKAIVCRYPYPLIVYSLWSYCEYITRSTSRGLGDVFYVKEWQALSQLAIVCNASAPQRCYLNSNIKFYHIFVIAFA